MPHKSGFVNIIGYPNTGKSTLLNNLLGTRLSIVTPKQQTTRHRILGMLNGDDYQIVFSDTPGILEPKYKLQESMMRAVDSVFADADHILLLVDLSNPREPDDHMLKRLGTRQKHVTVLLNKLDLVKQEDVEQHLAYWAGKLPKTMVRIISALHSHGTKELIGHILETLPESPPYYPKDQLTDRSERFIVSELVRKQVFQHTSQEVPYSCEVVVNSFKEAADIIRIEANIIVNRESQKMIVIGKGGKMIKKIGTEARKEIESFFGKKVFLELFVRVDKDWRIKETKLKKYGY